MKKAIWDILGTLVLWIGSFAWAIENVEDTWSNTLTWFGTTLLINIIYILRNKIL